MAHDPAFTAITQALSINNLTEARRLLHEKLTAEPDNANWHYLKGKMHMKEGDWGQAISSFKRAEEIDPTSPAKECRAMLGDIMDFYNKDMYNH